MDRRHQGTAHLAANPSVPTRTSATTGRLLTPAPGPQHDYRIPLDSTTTARIGMECNDMNNASVYMQI